MTPERFVAHQLVLRLSRIRRQIGRLTAEAEMIERALADVGKSAVVPHLKLRKNSQGKWTVRGQIRAFLADFPAPAKAQTIYEVLRRYDPSLKSSTFRSHIKRMVDDKIVMREGSRGYYRLVDPPTAVPKEPEIPTQPRKFVIRTRYP